jgi:hypothetical protein
MSAMTVSVADGMVRWADAGSRCDPFEGIGFIGEHTVVDADAVFAGRVENRVDGKRDRVMVAGEAGSLDC